MSWKPNSFYANANARTTVRPTETDPATETKLAKSHVDCRALGCVGDGITDDTKAMQKAIVLAGSLGCALLIPPGTYLITKRLDIIVPTTIVGGNYTTSIILYNGEYHPEANLDKDYWTQGNAAIFVGANNCRLENFTLQAGPLAGTSNGIIFHHPSVTVPGAYRGYERCKVEQVEIRKFKNGMFVYGGWNRNFSHCHFVDNLDSGIRWDQLEIANWSCSGDIVTACQFVGNDVAGISAECLFETTFWNCVFEYNGTAIIALNCNDITFKNCWNEENYDKIHVTGCAKFEGGYNIQPSTVEHTVVSGGDVVVFEAKASTIIKAGEDIVFNQQGGIITKGVQLSAELTNLFTNPTFGTVEAPSMSGWDIYVAPEAVNTTLYEGANTAHYACSGYTEDQGFGARQLIPVTTGKSYIFSVYVMSNNTSLIDSGGLIIYATHRNAAGETVRNDTRSLGTLTANGVWELKSVVVEATGDDASILFGIGCARNGDAYFAKPMLSRSDALSANDVFVRVQDATHLEVVNMSGVKIGTILITPV